MTITVRDLGVGCELWGIVKKNIPQALIRLLWISLSKVHDSHNEKSFVGWRKIREVWVAGDRLTRSMVHAPGDPGPKLFGRRFDVPMAALLAPIFLVSLA